MIVRNIKNEDIESLAKSANCKEVQFGKRLLSWIDKGITELDWCFVIEDNNDFLGRIVYGVFDNQLNILDINVKNFNKDIANELLRVSLERKELKEFSKIECHLYSDKIDFDQYVDMLIKNGFKIDQEKKSFVWQAGIVIDRPQKRLHFKSLEEITSDKYIDAIRQVTEKTLDRDDLNCIKEFGSKKAAINYFNLLKDIEFNKKWWKLAYSHNDELIGLIVPQKFNCDTGAINYIGVVPEKRGNGYVRDLLIEGIRVLSENNIKKIIGDIDVNNYPLEKALCNLDFKLDCKEVVLKLYL